MATASSNAFSIRVVAPVPGAWREISVGLPGSIVSTVRVVAAVPGQNKLIAASGLNYATPRIWKSTDNGDSWQEIGLGAGTQTPSLQPLGVLFDRQDSNVFWMFGNFADSNKGGLVKTINGGDTFAHTYSDEAEGVGVDFTDAMRRTIVIGRHEKPQLAYKTTNGGTSAGSWTNIGANLPAGTAYSQYPLVIDASTYLIGCSFTIPYGTGSTGGGTTGIYRTTNGGTSWTLVSPRAVYGTPLVVGTDIYWSYFDAGASTGGILFSSDNGQTWSDRTTGSLLYTAMPMRLPSGKFASMNTSRYVVVSPSASTGTWTQVGSQCPIGSPSGLSFNSATNSFVAYEVSSGRIYRMPVDAAAL